MHIPERHPLQKNFRHPEQRVTVFSPHWHGDASCETVAAWVGRTGAAGTEVVGAAGAVGAGSAGAGATGSTGA